MMSVGQHDFCAACRTRLLHLLHGFVQLGLQDILPEDLYLLGCFLR
jgi:hypothetical protein